MPSQPGDDRGEAERAPETGERELRRLRRCLVVRAGQIRRAGHSPGRRRARRRPTRGAPEILATAAAMPASASATRATAPIASGDRVEAVRERRPAAPRTRAHGPGASPANTSEATSPRSGVSVRRPTQASTSASADQAATSAGPPSVTAKATPASTAATRVEQQPDLATRARAEDERPEHDVGAREREQPRVRAGAMPGVVDQPPDSGRGDRRVDEEQRGRREPQRLRRCPEFVTEGGHDVEQPERGRDRERQPSRWSCSA